MCKTRRWVSLAVVLLLAGCQSRLSFDRSVRVEPGAVNTFEIDPPRYDQKMGVTIETDSPVTVWVYLKNDADAVEKDLTLKRQSDKVLATWTGDKSGTIECSVPAHQIAIVRLEAEKKAANVTVKVAGR
ncbi:MAG TPA: hypothetical protein VH120_20735 [Gemmataceae bacterium]|jgi:hypothetical protein|nr:hypothetical protein [Gemmataceae bacterium]